MNYQKQSVAILVSQEELYLRHAFLNEEGQVEMKGSKKLPNTPKEHWEAHMWIENQMGKHPEVRLVVVLEAAGDFHQAIINFLYDKGYSLYVVLPAKPEPGTSIPVPKSKAGRVEMAELVKTGLSGNLNKWEVPDSSMRKLKGLSQELIQRKKDLARSGKRLAAKKGSRDPIATMIKRLENYTQFLEKQITEINLDIKNMVEKDKELSQPIERISQTRGLDRITLATLISESDGYVLLH